MKNIDILTIKIFGENLEYKVEKNLLEKSFYTISWPPKNKDRINIYNPLLLLQLLHKKNTTNYYHESYDIPLSATLKYASHEIILLPEY